MALPADIAKKVDYYIGPLDPATQKRAGGKVAELGLKGKGAVVAAQLRNAAAKGDATKAAMALKVLAPLVSAANPSIKKEKPRTDDHFINKFGGGDGKIDAAKIKVHMQDKINSSLGSLAGAKAHHNIGLSGMDKVSYKNELRSYIYFKNTIDKALAAMGDKPDVRVFKIIMTVLDTMVKQTRDDFFRRTKQATSTGKWDSKAADNIRLFQSLHALISAPTVEEAAEDLFVIYDDLPNESKQSLGHQPTGPSAKVQDLSGVTDEESANQWLSAHGMEIDQMDDLSMDNPDGNEVQMDPDDAEPVAEDFGSKIRGIFNEKYEAIYKKALNESLKK